VIVVVEFFKCPLCGLRRIVNGWHPALLNDVIMVQEVEGAGRGRGFRTVSEEDATESRTTGLDLPAMAERCLKIVEICLKSSQVSASDLVDDVPWQLQDEVVREKAEDYGYRESTT
jgi:hypothetical protein